jgi:hypothetical protein
MRSHWFAWLVIASLALGAFWFGVATRPFNVQLERERPSRVYDFFSYYRPNAEYAFTRLHQGEMPLWNPHQGLGQPFLATLQTGVLYPPNWLHLALPPQRAFAWLACLHIVLATLLAGALASSLGAGAVGSVAAGLLYASSVQIWSSAFTPPTLYTAAWAPGVLFAVERAIARPGTGRATALACALALQILAGWPYAVVMTALAAGILGLASLAAAVRRTRRIPFAALATLAIGASAGGLLAAPQLLPSLELVRQSTRAPGTLDESTAGLQGEMHDPEFFVQNFLHTGLSGGVPGLASPVLALAAVLFAGFGRARAAVLLGIAALALAISFPHHTPLYDWARRLPLLGDFRFPFRYRLLSTLAIAVAAGIGVSRLERRWGHIGIGAAVLVAALAVAVQAWPMAHVFQQTVNSFPRERPHPAAGLFRQLALKNEVGRQIAIAKQPGFHGSRSYWRAFGIDKLGEERDLLTLQDLEPLSLATTSRFMTYLAKADAGVDPARSGGVRPTLGAPYAGSAPIPGEPSRAALFDVMSVRLVVTDSPPAWLDTQMRRVADVRDAPFVFENPHALPRAWRALRGEATPADPQAALARLVDPGFDVHTTVLLDPLPPEFATGDAKPDASAETRIEIDQPEHVAIRTRGATAALLVLNDSLYPGWEATLDSTPVPLLRANTAFRAVAVPPGEHVVDMRYRPRSYRLGLALAGVTAFALTLAMLRERIRAAEEEDAEEENAEETSRGE